MLNNTKLQEYLSSGKNVVLGDKGLILVLYPNGSVRDSLGNSVMPADAGRAGMFATESINKALKTTDIASAMNVGLSEIESDVKAKTDEIWDKFDTIVAENIEPSEEATSPKTEEFNALLRALKESGLMKPDVLDGIEFFADAPTTGATLSKPTIGEHGTYEIIDYVYVDEEDKEWDDKKEADPEMAYTLTVTFATTAGYVFDDLADEDITEPSGSTVTETVTNEDGTVTVTVEWAATAAAGEGGG